MNQPPNNMGSNIPAGYGPPPGYGPQQGQPGYGAPPSGPGFQQPTGPMPQSGSYAPPPPHSGYAQPYPQQGFRGMTRQMFNPASYRQQGSGSWAAASLILSLVSFFLCLGLISPLPMLFGLIGMIGNKRAKGMAFAGFVISAVQVVGWVAFMGLGMHLQFQSEEMSKQGGAPVVAAIEEFKADNGRVPSSLTELVVTGYLPETWEQGFDDTHDAVQKVVKGKKWHEFLRYKPGAEATWTGSGYVDEEGKVSIENIFDVFEDFPSADKDYQNYGLVFIGVDNAWEATETAVPQAQDPKFDLISLWGGDATSREALKSKREIATMIRKVDAKLKAINDSEATNKNKLAEHEKKLRQIIADKGLSADQVKGDEDAGDWLKLVGETARLVKLTENKRTELNRTRNRLEVQMERLGNQVELAKLADSKDELAKLQLLLEESKKTLDADDSSFVKVTDEQAADEWLKANVK